MPTCKEVAENATEYLEKAMPPRERLGVWAHLRVCPNCRAYLRQLIGTVALTRRAHAAAQPSQDEDRLVAMMRAAQRPGAADRTLAPPKQNS